MANTRDVAAYICKEFPHKKELTNEKLSQLMYLADWEAAVQTGEPLTSISWRHQKFGPVDEDNLHCLQKDQDIHIEQTYNMYGDKKIMFSLSTDNPTINLSDDERSIIDEVISKTDPLFCDAFRKHVHSTYPIRMQNSYHCRLDLVTLAHEYKEKVNTH